MLISAKQQKSFDGKIDPLSQKLYVFNEVKDDYWEEYIMDDKEEEVMNDDDDNEKGEQMQYSKYVLKHRGHAPDKKEIKSKVDVNEDIQ